MYSCCLRQCHVATNEQITTGKRNNFVYMTSYKRSPGTKKTSYMVLPACDYQKVQLKLEGYSWKQKRNQIKLHLHLEFLLQHIAGDTRTPQPQALRRC